MANPHPTPRPENLRSPWQPGTSGNPAGYSRGRRISDAIENMIDEQGLERSFAATAIAMALGHKHTLRQLVKDPVTGVDVWVEHKPDLAWFKMIVPRPRIEPAAQQPDAVTRLRTILDNIDRKRAAQEEQDKAAESAGPSPSGSRRSPPRRGPSGLGAWRRGESSVSQHALPGRASASRQRPQSLAIRRSPLATFQDVPAHAGSGQVALQAAQVDLPAGDPGTTLAVERPFCQRSGRSCTVFSSCSIRPGMLSGSRRSLPLSLRDCSRETSAALLPGSSRSGPDWQAGSAGRWRRSPSSPASCSFTRPSSSMTSVPAATSFRRARSRLTSNMVPRSSASNDSSRCRVSISRSWAGSSPTSLQAIWLPARSWPGKLAPEPGTLVTRSTFPELYPVLAPERPPDGKPAPTSKT